MPVTNADGQLLDLSGAVGTGAPVPEGATFMDIPKPAGVTQGAVVDFKPVTDRLDVIAKRLLDNTLALNQLRKDLGF